MNKDEAAIEGRMTTAVKYYSVKNWEKYQHYHDAEKTGRIMPWLKLYSALHDDLGFYELSDMGKLIWPHILILALKTSNRIPNNPEWVASRIGVNVKCDLQELVTSGFLIPHVVNPSIDCLDKNTTEERRLEEIKNREDKIRIKDSAERKSASAPPPVKINFDFTLCAWQNISETDLAGWSDAYPAVNVATELSKMREWLKSNPTKRKSNYRAFITRWLTKAQEHGGYDRGGGRPPARQSKRGGGDMEFTGLSEKNYEGGKL